MHKQIRKKSRKLHNKTYLMHTEQGLLKRLQISHWICPWYALHHAHGTKHGTCSRKGSTESAKNTASQHEKKSARVLVQPPDICPSEQHHTIGSSGMDSEVFPTQAPAWVHHFKQRAECWPQEDEELMGFSILIVRTRMIFRRTHIASDAAEVVFSILQVFHVASTRLMFSALVQLFVAKM